MTYTFKLSRRLAAARWAYFAMLMPFLLLSAACTDRELPTDSAGWDQVSQIEVSPNWLYAEVNQPVQLKARDLVAARADGSVDASQPVDVEWTASGGTITQDGLFTADSEGRYRVVGKERGGRKSDTTTVDVGRKHPKVVALVLTPDTATVEPGQARQFATEGVLSDGSRTRIGTEWTADGGTIDAGGNYVAGSESGHFHVIATNVDGTLADTARVDVSAPSTSEPSLVAVELTPASVSLTVGGTQQFAVQGRLSDGGTTSVAAQFSASGGTISNAGLYTAGGTPGTYQVVARSAEGAADTSTVAVTGAFTGTVIYPGTSIQAAVDANPAGTSFLLKAGVHRMQRVNPKNGNVFTGEPGTIVSGARELLNFTRSGSYWVVGGQTQEGQASDVKHCEAGYESCQWPEDLFLDDRLLLRVTSLAQVGPGKWYFDYSADKIYLGDDPTGHRVETGVSAYAFGGTADNVTLRSLVIEKYAASARSGIIQGDATSGWLIEGLEVRQSHAIGIRVGDRWTVRRTRVHHNGQLGIAGGGTGSVVEDSEWDHNKVIGFKVGFSGGASKFHGTNGLVLRRNYVHDNDGNGIWLDINNVGYLIEGNRVEDNYGQGIFIEISYGGKILNNEVRRNGLERGGSWLYGAGILVAHSPDVEVAGNTVEDNANGIAGIQQNRGDHILENLWVHDNVVRMSRGRTGVGDATGSGAYSRNNRFERNTYVLAGTAKYFTWNGGTLSDNEWRAAGQDVQGTFRR